MPECKCGCGETASESYKKGHNARASLESRFWSRVPDGTRSISRKCRACDRERQRIRSQKVA